MIPTDPQQLAEHIARIEGLMDGAIKSLQWGVTIIGGLLVLLIGSVVYSFQQLTSVVEVLRKRSYRMIIYYNLVAVKLGLPVFSNGD